MDDTPTEAPWHETAPIPAMFRHARTTYGSAMRKALAMVDCDDMPKNGMYVIGGMAMGAGGVPLAQLVRELGVSKQAAGQLVDTLVLRGYLDRTVDPLDRRRLTITLTERGMIAAAAQAEARQRVDQALTDCVGPECVAQMRRALAVLSNMGRTDKGEAEAEH